MAELGPPHFDEADKAFAEEIRKTLSPQEIASIWRTIGMPDSGAPLADFLVPLDAKRNPAIGSTDVGDVFLGGADGAGRMRRRWRSARRSTPGRWSRRGKQPAAHKAMVHVAKAMAATGAAVLSDPRADGGGEGRSPAHGSARRAMSRRCQPEVMPPLTMSLGG